MFDPLLKCLTSDQTGFGEEMRHVILSLLYAFYLELSDSRNKLVSYFLIVPIMLNLSLHMATEVVPQRCHMQTVWIWMRWQVNFIVSFRSKLFDTQHFKKR